MDCARRKFYWEKLHRQVRIRGHLEKTKAKFLAPLLTTFLSAKHQLSKLVHNATQVEDSQSDAYFETRSRDSQIGAWASDQSEEISDTSVVENRIKELEQQFKDTDVPRPPYWGGYRLIPSQIEFWTDKKFRLHERILYTKNGQGNWSKKLLSP